MEAARGTVFRFGDNVDTDVIIPARYLATSEPSELAAHCMEDIDKTFIQKVKKGDMIVAGRNFGCGSSREHAPIAIKEAAAEIQEGETVSINFDTGVITDETTGKTYQGQAFPPFMQGLIDAGGLINYVNSQEA